MSKGSQEVIITDNLEEWNRLVSEEPKQTKVIYYFENSTLDELAEAALSSLDDDDQADMKRICSSIIKEYIASTGEIRDNEEPIE